jgi:hypothetical protein
MRRLVDLIDLCAPADAGHDEVLAVLEGLLAVALREGD